MDITVYGLIWLGIILTITFILKKLKNKENKNKVCKPKKSKYYDGYYDGYHDAWIYFDD